LSDKTEKTAAELPTELTITRTPEAVAAEICALKSQTQTIILHASVEIGRRLTEVKAMLTHGLWGNWLSVYVDYSQSTANKLMKLYEEYKDKVNSETFTNLTYSKAIALLGVPADEREQFAEENDVKNMSTRELKKAIKEKEELEKQLEAAQTMYANKSEEARKIFEAKQQLESDARVTDQVLREKKELVENLQKSLAEERKSSKEKAEKLAEAIAETKKQLTEAQSAGNEALVGSLQESLEKTDNELLKSLEKIADLEKQLLEKPIEATVATVENVPEEVERELAELRGKVTELEAKPDQQISEGILKFKLHFEQLTKCFNDILADIEEIGQTDAEAQAKRIKVVGTLLDKMSERL